MRRKMDYQVKNADPTIIEEKQQLLEQHLLKINIQRSKLFAKVVIILEIILILMNVTTSYLGDHGVLVLNIYIILYLILFVTSALLLLYIRLYEKKDYNTKLQNKRLQKGLYTYLHFFLLWSSVVTLVDQKEYGHVMVFVVNVMISILFQVSSRTLFSLYVLPICVLYIGLPMFQPSQEILLGHYINTTIFLIFCIMTSRLLYKSSCDALLNKLLLIETNNSLTAKIEENEKINQQLETLNQHLSKMTIIDELTNIPNRRGFQQYIYSNLPKTNDKRKLSIMMIDIDDFKLYNDHYGHLEGDKVIKTVAKKIQESLANTSTSMAARFGGEEFVIAIFDLDDEDVDIKAEEIRKAVIDTQIPHEYSSAEEFVTISVGIATSYVNNKNEYLALVESADQALYNSKFNGKNCVGRMQESKV